MSIPRIIHQIWIGPRPQPTKWLRSWQEMCPDWEYRLWTEKNINGLRNARHYTNSATWSGKANVIRYELLHRFGGFYLDADTVARKPLDDLVEGNDFIVVVDRDATEDAPEHYCNGIMACTPEHPLMWELVEELGKVKPCKLRKRLYAWAYSGPDLVTRVVQPKADQVLVLPRTSFLPHTEAERKDAYADHHWGSTSGSWAAGVEKEENNVERVETT